MRRINRCLNKQLAALCQEAFHLHELDEKLQEHLPENLRGFCRVASFNKGCLKLSISKPALATELRYFLPELRDRLREKVGWHQLVSIQIQPDPTSRGLTAGSRD